MKLKSSSLFFYKNRGLKKYLLIMKLTWFLILAITLQTSATVWSQATKMDVKVTNSSLQELFRQIEDNSDYRFFYNNDDVDVSQKVTVKVENKTIGDILTEVFDGLPYSFKEMNDNLILIEKVQAVNKLNKKGVFQLKGIITIVAEKLKVSEATVYRYLSTS